MSLPNEFQRYHSAVVEISRHARTQPIEPHLDPVPPQYSLVLWVHQRTQKQIAKVAKVLNREAPGQFIYSPDRYHMTVMGGIPVDHCAPEELSRVVKELLGKHSLRLLAYGIGTSSTAAAAAVYCKGDCLIDLRSAMSEAIGWKSDYAQYDLALAHVGWVCFLRYRSQPPVEYYDVLESFMEYGFGNLDTYRFGLYQVTGRTFAPGTYQLITEF